MCSSDLKSKDKSQTERKIFADTCLTKDLFQNIQRTLTQTTPLKIGKALNKHLVKEGTQIVHRTMPRIEGQRNIGPAQVSESCVTLD